MAEWGWCVYARIRGRVCISDSRLSLKLKQKSTRPPSCLYLFMPSAAQHPHARKHTNPPALCHTNTHILATASGQVGANAPVT